MLWTGVVQWAANSMAETTPTSDRESAMRLQLTNFWDFIRQNKSSNNLTPFFIGQADNGDL